jgi:hypothetical protein
MRSLSSVLRQVVALVLVVAAFATGTQTAAAQEYPDFYGTIVAADRDLGFVVVQVDKGDDVLVNVEFLGEQPWNEGVFQLDNVVILRTQRIGADYMAISWEEARNGRERFGG